MEPEYRLLTSGTMRSGGSLLNNLLCAHSKIFLFGERFHFFRFCYNKYNPLTEKSVRRMLEHQRLRMRYRFEIDFDVDGVFAAIKKHGLTYDVIFDEGMKYFLDRVKRPIWGEHVAMHWRDIPVFVNMYDNARAIHIYRDPRSVVASWKKLCFPTENQYLNAIFNWIDSVQCIERYTRELPAHKYMAIKYEDLVAEPERHTRRLCKFIGVEFEADMMKPETWHARLPKEMMINPKSAHEGENIRGFSMTRTKNWVKSLEEWELALIENLAHDPMRANGYEFHKDAYKISDVHHGLKMMASVPKLMQRLAHLWATGEGSPHYFYDPTDPKTWGAARRDISAHFTDAEGSDANTYFQKLAELDAVLDAKYGK